MFKDLDWKGAFRRAALIVAIWLVTLYILSTAFPESFDLGLDSAAGVTAMAINGAVFFVFFAVLTAFTERSKRRSRQNAAQRGKGPEKKTPAAPRTEEEDGPGDLRGRPNPNTSRRKTSRQRRRR